MRVRACERVLKINLKAPMQSFDHLTGQFSQGLGISNNKCKYFEMVLKEITSICPFTSFSFIHTKTKIHT